jgi:hypothetical protein
VLLVAPLVFGVDFASAERETSSSAPLKTPFLCFLVCWLIGCLALLISAVKTEAVRFPSRNFHNTHIEVHTASQPRIPPRTASPPCEPQVSYSVRWGVTMPVVVCNVFWKPIST